MSSSEMRIFDRSSVCCPAHVFVSGAGEPEPSFVTDLCEGGAFVQTRQKLRRGDRLYVRLNLDHEKVADATGEVAWVRPFEPVSVDGQLPGVGVRFVDLSPDDRLAIRGFVGDGQASPLVVSSLLPQPVEQAPSLEWHDTDVDEPAPELHSEEELSVGYEPELGDLELQEPQPQLSELRVQRNWTPWLAVGSLALGISAGAVYGLLAHADGAAQLAVSSDRDSAEGAHPSPTASASPLAAQASAAPAQESATHTAVAVKDKGPARPSFAIPRAGDPAPQAVALPGKPQAAKTPRSKASPRPPSPERAQAPKSATPRTRSYLSAPQSTGMGWYISLAGGARALKHFGLENPARVVVDMPPGSVRSLSNRDMHTGPFARLRVGRTGERTRLVFDLDDVLSASKVRFVKKGGDLVIELPKTALARR